MVAIRQEDKPDVHFDLPAPPADRDVVLHTRVVTESGGGPEKTILLSASHMRDTNYWLAAAYMHPPEDDGFDIIRARAAQFNCPLISVPDRGALDRTVVKRMLDICRHYNVRIWHAHDYKSNLLGVMLRPFHDMRLVTTLHGWVKNTIKTPLYYAVDRLCLPYYHHVLCVSQDLYDRAMQVGVPADRCSLVRNAIDSDLFHRDYPASRSPLRREFGTPAGRLVLGAVGRLSAEKGFAELIRSIDTLVREGHDVELWIAGDGDQRAGLTELVHRLGLTDRVRLLGFRADTIELFHAMDLFVLSSIREGLPNVVLEAMAMEVPVVSTRVAEVPGVLTDGLSGILCEVGDQKSLTDAVRRAVTDAVLRQQCADAARNLIERQFTFSARMAKVRAIYDRVTAREPTAVTVGAT